MTGRGSQSNSSPEGTLSSLVGSPRRHCQWRFVLALFALPFAAALAGVVVWAAPRLAISPVAYQLVSITEATTGSSRAFDVTLRAGILNFGDPALNVTAQLTSTTPVVVVLDGDLHFGDVPTTRAGRPVASRDTFRLRISLPRERPLLALYTLVSAILSDLQWQVGCGNCGATANRPPLADAGMDQTVRVASQASWMAVDRPTLKVQRSPIGGHFSTDRPAAPPRSSTRNP